MSKSSKQTFEQFLDAVIDLATQRGFRMRPPYIFGYEKKYWQELHAEGLTPRQAWERNNR
jgi:hypothetical protein